MNKQCPAADPRNLLAQYGGYYSSIQFNPMEDVMTIRTADAE
jgi:hypothetical protein